MLRLLHKSVINILPRLDILIKKIDRNCVNGIDPKSCDLRHGKKRASSSCQCHYVTTANWFRPYLPFTGRGKEGTSGVWYVEAMRRCSACSEGNVGCSGCCRKKCPALTRHVIIVSLFTDSTSCNYTIYIRKHCYGWYQS